MLAKEKLDAVSVCTYNRQHAPCVIDALNAGIDVLVEKPFTVTIEEAAEIIKTEKKTGRILSIGFQPRFDPNMRMIKKIVESGELGKIYYIQTGGGRRRGIPASLKKFSFIQDETAGIGALADISRSRFPALPRLISVQRRKDTRGLRAPKRLPSISVWTILPVRLFAWRAVSFSISALPGR